MTASGVLLFSILIGGTQVAWDKQGIINDVLGLSRTNLKSAQGSDYAEADGSLTDKGYWKMIADSYQYCIEEEEQGAVMFKNDNNVLPLAKTERKVTLFGRNSAHLMHRSGAGGAAPNEKLVVHLDEAFKNCGFEINDTVWNLYKSGGNQSVTGNDEIAESRYTDSVKATFDEYNDAAIVTFTRFGTEDTDPSDGILDLQNNEKALLRMIKNSGKFSKTIVLLNSPSAMGMEFANNPEYGVDAVIWMGVPGYYSLEGLVHILTGEANPSGHAPDTFANYSRSSAAYQNFGHFSGSNTGSGRGDTYVVYKEGIYVGYKYYETRYEDCILDQGNANGSKGVYAGTGSWDYAAEMGYPFGYGMSYTTFAQKITDVKYDEATDKYTVTVNVKNTGAVEGRASAQVYFQAPYTEDNKSTGLEKAAVNLAGYDKVLLAPGASKDVKISFDKYFLCSYDYKNAKSYVLDEGDYYFGVGNGAHEALNNIIALKKESSTGLFDHNGEAYEAPANSAVKVHIAEDYATYKKSIYDKSVDVTNQFDNADLNYWKSGAFEYLTRNDWEGTFPTKMTSLSYTQAMNNEVNNNRYKTPADSKAYYDEKDDDGNYVNFQVKLKDEEGNARRIKFSEMAKVPLTGTYTDDNGVEHDAEKMWNEFISQMSVKELAISMSDNRGILGVASVSKPSNSIAEGPEGLLAQFNYGDKRWATGFATGPIYSATWDHEMQAKYGAFYGEEALFCGAACVNAPGANINRTPYGSRASEYMSEDGIMNYYIASNVVGAARKKGLIMNIKHCFLNNQETNRHGVCTFANEQSIREIYLKPFEGALTRGEGMGIMTSYNRIGCTYAAVHSPLMNNVMRGEWAYKGLIIDDAQQGGNTDAYANGPLMLDAGTNVFCLDSGRGGQLTDYVTSNHDGNLLQKMQESNKYIMYAMLRSFMGDAGDALEADINRLNNSWWKITIRVVDIVAGVFMAACLGMYVFTEFFAKKKDEEVAE